MNNKGFVFIDALFSFSLIITLVVLIVPIITLINTERNILSERRLILSFLHDSLQSYIIEEKSISDGGFKREFFGKIISFVFIQDDGSLIKSCASWHNINNRYEKVCLYGKIQK